MDKCKSMIPDFTFSKCRSETENFELALHIIITITVYTNIPVYWRNQLITCLAAPDYRCCMLRHLTILGLASHDCSEYWLIAFRYK